MFTVMRTADKPLLTMVFHRENGEDEFVLNINSELPTS